MAINDFGEKIGGAKKDLWKLRGLGLEDLPEMNATEKLNLIKKDNVWPKPDYAALAADGLPVKVVYYIKKVRDSLGVQPVLTNRDNTPEAVLDKQEKYIKFVGAVKEAVLACKSDGDILALGKEWLTNNGYIEPGGSYRVTPTKAAGDVITNKFLRAFWMTRYDLSCLDREIEKKQFLYTDEQKILARYDFLCYINETWTKDNIDRDVIELQTGGGRWYVYPRGEFADENSWVRGSYFVMSKSPRRIVARNFNSIEDAKRFVLDNDKGKDEVKPKKKGKSRFIPPQLAHIQRDGEDVRHGRSIAGQDYLNVFEFKGGEFGNWMSEKDSQASLNMGYEALYDLAKALKIDYKDISLGNSLSIAFGARGSGSALAHYEPMREVINLTKKRGAGSLAHEWGHALDDILGKRLGLTGFMTANLGNDKLPESFKTLIEKMHYKVLSVQEVKANRDKEIEEYKGRVHRFIDGLLPNSLMSEKQIVHKERLIKAFFENVFDSNAILGYLNCVNSGEGVKTIDTLSAFKKEVVGEAFSKEEGRKLALCQNTIRNMSDVEDKPQTVKTEFYKNSIRFDELHSKTDHGYWKSNEEMFARAFACYVHDKIEGRSDFLCGHSEMAVKKVLNESTGDYEVIRAIPDGDERVVINQYFDNLFEELKKMGLLHHKEDFTVEVQHERIHDVASEWGKVPQTEEEAYPVSLLDMLDDAYARSERTGSSGEQMSFDMDKLF